MRDAAFIMDLWQRGGPFEGPDGKANTIVTVQDPWTGDPAVVAGDEDHVIHPTTNAGNARARGVPIRWYQKADNSQTERVIPNVKMVSIDRSIEADAATCNITIANQWMYDNGTVPADKLAEGNRQLSGFFTPERGAYPDATARWGHEVNEWAGVFVPNAVLRTYQGYGGHNKTLAQALADGNVILSGVWLIDEVNITTDGNMEVACRDMAKLLIEQQLFPPLVPADHYPLTYYRWTYDNFAVSASTQNIRVSNTTNVPVGNKRAVYRDSSTDRWYGANTVLHGHKGTDSLDGNTGTYWLSVGNAGPDRAFATDWIEYECGEAMNAVYVHPWAGNYTMYVSVMVGGKWQGSSKVPYDPSELYGSQPTVVDTGADIPYVKSFGVPWEAGKTYVLPDTYVAQRVRISFRHLAYSGIGPWYYRAGVREFRIRADASAEGTTTNTTWTLTPLLFASDGHPVSGYVTITNLWQIDAFGEAREQPPDGPLRTSVSPIGLAVTPSGNGYYALDQAGDILTYGDATHLGDPKGSGFNYVVFANGMTDIALTPSGNGYWAVGVTTGGAGVLYAYGDAQNLGVAQPTGESALQQITSTPSGNGYWLMDTNGVVTAFGDAVNYGSFTEMVLDYQAFTDGGITEGATSFASTSTGNGYWILTNRGRVQAFGDAGDFGQPVLLALSAMTFGNSFVNIIPSPVDTGYLITHTSGMITPFGDVDDYGGPVVGSTGRIRMPGNYADYADIIKDLALWAGFLLYDNTLGGNEPPAVFGNIETTGAYARDKLPDEIFDKRPVIDAMTEIKEVVGYLLFVDDEGGLRFESPNFWSMGNFLQETGQRVNQVPEIDERLNLFKFGASRNDDSLRSLIIISSEDPTEAGDTTVTTSLVPQTATGLRGILKPAMWINGWFQDEDEQYIMAELISMHIWFAQRVGQVTCVANPAIQINDQVRIFERQTAEVFLHYVRGINTTHDLETGDYTMTLTTHWLGTGDDWAITSDSSFFGDETHFVVSDRTMKFVNFSDTEQSILNDSNNYPRREDPLGPDGNPNTGAGPE